MVFRQILSWFVKVMLIFGVAFYGIILYGIFSSPSFFKAYQNWGIFIGIALITNLIVTIKLTVYGYNFKAVEWQINIIGAIIGILIIITIKLL